MADQLVPIPLVTPGFKGLNTAQSSVPDLDPGWAVVCQNFVFDVSGRLAARMGWVNQTTTPIAGTPAIQSMGELFLANGQSFVVSAANNKLFMGTTTLTDITGSLTITANNWQWMTFNGALYGVQAGHPLITFNGTGTFEVAPTAPGKAFTASIANVMNIPTMTVTALAAGSPLLNIGDLIVGTNVPAGTQIIEQLSGVAGSTGAYQISQAPNTVASESMTVAPGTPPSGGSCGVAAFGRLWILDSDNQTIQYSALLDATTWYTNPLAPNGAGSISMATVWTRGIDQVIGIAAAGAKLVVFGRNQVILFADDTGAVIGLNPQNIFASDTIEGTGLVARDTVQSTGEGDLTWLSPTGVQSLQRLLSSGRDNPVAALDTHIHDYMNGFVTDENPAAIRSMYSPLNRFYTILLPTSQRAFVYDTRMPLPGGGVLGEMPGALRVTEWPAVTWSSLLSLRSGVILYGENGIVGQYEGFLDNNVPYTINYNSPSIALSNSTNSFENRQKVLKRMKAVLFFSGNTTVVFTWGVDFNGLNNSYIVPLMGVLSEYGAAQYGISDYGGGAGITVQGFPLSLSGRWLQFGLSAQINGFQLAIQQLDAFVKIGNMV